jgi:hypothetical protein
MRTPRISAAIFISLATIAAGCAASSPTVMCKNPASIEGKWDAAAPGYIVAVRKDKDLDTVVARLARIYHLKPFLLRTTHGFILPELNDAVLQQLRCERDVEYISHDQSTSIGEVQ